MPMADKIKAMVGKSGSPAYTIPAVFNIQGCSELSSIPKVGSELYRIIAALKDGGVVVGGPEYPGLWAIIPEWKSKNPPRLTVEALNKIRGYGYGFRYDPETDKLHIREPGENA